MPKNKPENKFSPGLKKANIILFANACVALIFTHIFLPWYQPTEGLQNNAYTSYSLFALVVLVIVDFHAYFGHVSKKVSGIVAANAIILALAGFALVISFVGLSLFGERAKSTPFVLPTGAGVIAVINLIFANKPKVELLTIIAAALLLVWFIF